MLQKLVEAAVPSETPTLREIKSRHSYLIEKHIFGFQDLSAPPSQSSASGGGDGGGGGGDGPGSPGGGSAGGGGGGDGSSGANKRGHIDLGALEDQLLKKADASSEGGAVVIPEVKEVDDQMEDVKRELSIAKDRLVVALKSEVYNEKTGIGETIHGLPLGCLSLKLIMMEGVNTSSAKNVSVVISLKSTARGDTAAPGPPAQVSKAGRPNPDSSKQFPIDFNQTFTLAPIKSHDAQLIFDIMDAGADPKRRGTCKMHLRDLADQVERKWWVGRSG